MTDNRLIVDFDEVIHKKTGAKCYALKQVVIDCTNDRVGELAKVYYKDGKWFVRELNEFNEKFET